MEKLVRFGVSMEEELLNQFDHSIEGKGYANRSEALRDLVRRCLVDTELKDQNRQAVGVISFVYDHERRELARHLVQMGHKRMKEIVSSLHVHIDENHCLEVIVTRGKIGELRDLAEQIFANRGVIKGDLHLTALPPTL